MILCFFAKSIRWGLLRSLLFLDQRSTCCCSIWSLLVIWILSCRLILGCGFTCEASSSSFLNGFCCNSWLSSCRKHMHVGFLWIEDHQVWQVKFWSFHNAIGFGWISMNSANTSIWNILGLQCRTQDDTFSYGCFIHRGIREGFCTPLSTQMKKADINELDIASTQL
jgi:hypothetical protein